MEIVEHIAKSSTNNQAVTTEMLDEALPDLKASFPKVLDREEIHARKADIVFLMLLSPEQTGVQGEIVMISHDKGLKSKSWLFLPKRWPRESFLTQAVSDFPNERKLQLTFPQIRECLRIRSFCDEKLAELRSEKQLESLRFKAFKESLS
jgi:hypothetical protein